MSRLRRFPYNRFIGRRDTMIFFDCDDSQEFEVLETEVSEKSLDLTRMLQSFAPDTAKEAANRGFSPIDLTR